jgi:glutathione synthase/RimK-type ligase-like ATP-grasp enzyme
MSAEYDVTILTYAEFPELYPDDRLLRKALERRGARVRVAVWDDPAVDWSNSAITLFRSTWDYFEKPAAFMAFVDRVDPLTHLINSANTVRWNANKAYLLELRSRGIPCVPTALLEAGGAPALAELCRERGWHDVVIKPAISGASYLTRRFAAGASSEAIEHAGAMLERGRDVLVQPFLPQVEADGEYALIFIGTVFSHAARKLPFHGIPHDGKDLEESIEVPPEYLALAHRIVGELPERPAYARVDFVPTCEGPLLMELELIEPSLFFYLNPDAADSLADEVIGTRTPPGSFRSSA